MSSWTAEAWSLSLCIDRAHGTDRGACQCGARPSCLLRWCAVQRDEVRAEPLLRGLVVAFAGPSDATRAELAVAAHAREILGMLEVRCG